MRQAEEFSSQPKTLYADKIHGIGVGPFVSRLMLANEEPDSKKSIPVINVIMPTSALLELCIKALEVMSNKDVQDQLSSLNQEFFSKLSSLKIDT